MKSVKVLGGLTPIEVTSGLEVPAQDRSLLFLKSGLFTALLANVLWGTSFLASKYTLISWGPFTASALRFLIASILMFAGMTLFKRKIRVPRSSREWFGILAVAVTGFGFLYPLQLSGLKLITSGMSAAIMLTSPLFVILSARAFLGETLTRQKILAIALGIAGGTLLLAGKGGFGIAGSSEFLTGVGLTGLASMSLALSVIATRKASASFDSGSLTFWSMLIGFILLAISAEVFESSGLVNSLRVGTAASWSALVFLSLVCSAFCFFIWNYALSKATPKEIASTMHIKTPTAVLLGALIAGEHLGAPLILGSTIVMTGVWISQRNPNGRRS